MENFRNKIAIVTGGGSGIGCALSKKLAFLGAKVIVADINLSSVEEVAKQIQKQKGHAKAFALDVADAKAVQKLVDNVVKEYGSIDYMFNNAGIGIAGEVRDYTLEDWYKVLDVDLRGVVHGVHAVYPYMIKQKSGHIVNTASVFGLVPTPLCAPYTAAKFGVVGLTLVLREEACALGVKASVVCPGPIKTAIFSSMKAIKTDPHELIARQPFLDFITPEKCASVIVKGVARNKSIIVITRWANVIWRIFRFFPNLFIKLTRPQLEDAHQLRKE